MRLVHQLMPAFLVFPHGIRQSRQQMGFVSVELDLTTIRQLTLVLLATIPVKVVLGLWKQIA